MVYPNLFAQQVLDATCNQELTKGCGLQVKEINELRFVLCPKRMNDAQFWIVYFSLARKYMPPEAFDPGFSVPEAGEKGEPQRKLLDLQEGIRKTFETAKQTASRWKDRATNTLQPAGMLCIGTPSRHLSLQNLSLNCHDLKTLTPLAVCASIPADPQDTLLLNVNLQEPD